MFEEEITFNDLNNIFLPNYVLKISHNALFASPHCPDVSSNLPQFGFIHLASVLIYRKALVHE